MSSSADVGREEVPDEIARDDEGGGGAEKPDGLAGGGRGPPAADGHAAMGACAADAGAGVGAADVAGEEGSWKRFCMRPRMKRMVRI